MRITQGIMPQHSRSGIMRAMSQFGEVVYCRKPPYSGIPGEDYVNIGFATQSAAEKAYAELKAGRIFIDGFLVGVGPAPKESGSSAGVAAHSCSRSKSRRRGSGGGGGGGGRRSNSRRRATFRQEPIRGTFKQRHDERSPSPRTIAREAMMNRRASRPKSKDRNRSRSRSRKSSSSSNSRSKGRSRRRRS